MALSSAGACYGTARSAASVASAAQRNPAIAYRCMVPIVIAGVLAIYGLIVSIIIVVRLGAAESLGAATGWTHLTAGLITGFSCLFSGLAVGRIGQSGLDAYCDSCFDSAPEPASRAPEVGPATPLMQTEDPPAPLWNRSVYTTLLLNLVYAEAIGLYGLIVGIILLAT
eukprot:jgi/Tetstr1/440865/TSEL_029138.t1